MEGSYLVQLTASSEKPLVFEIISIVVHEGQECKTDLEVLPCRR